MVLFALKHKLKDEVSDVDNSEFLFNPLKPMRKRLYLNPQSVPRCKHFSSRLQKPLSLCYKWHKSLFVL